MCNSQFEDFVVTFKGNCRNKAGQSWELGDSLQKDMIEPFKALKAAQELEAAELHAQGSEMIQQLRAKLDEVKLYEMTYWKEAKTANSLAEDFHKIMLADKHSVEQKKQLEKDLQYHRSSTEEKQIIYKSIVKRANEFKQFYVERMNQLMGRLQEHERERVETCREAAQKIIVYETSLEMNNKYDAKAFQRVVDGIESDKSVRFFQGKVNLLRVI